MLAFNAVMFVIVIVVLIKHKLKRSSSHNNTFDSIRLMVNITSIFFLFGLTWIFGALTILKANHTFQIVFTLINSFQGFLIFIFFCVLNKDVRLSWLQLVAIRRCEKKWSQSPASKSTTLRNLITHVQNAGTGETDFNEEIKELELTKQLPLPQHSVTSQALHGGAELNYCEVAKL